MVGIIKSKEEVAKGTLKVVFEVKEKFTFKAGQYCFITLPQLNYPDERGLKRHFSIVNSPKERGIITFTTRISESGFKKSLQELPVGTEVQLGPIAGAFVLPEDSQKPLVLIAGGIGITPFISMLRYVSQEKIPYKITLIYSNRDQYSTAYFEEVKNLTAQIPGSKLILTMTDDPNWNHEKKVVDASFIKDYFPEVNSQYYMVVGPPGMVSAVEQALLEAGVNTDNIKIENFTGY